MKSEWIRYIWLKINYYDKCHVLFAIVNVMFKNSCNMRSVYPQVTPSINRSPTYFDCVPSSSKSMEVQTISQQLTLLPSQYGCLSRPQLSHWVLRSARNSCPLWLWKASSQIAPKNAKGRRKWFKREKFRSVSTCAFLFSTRCFRVLFCAELTLSTTGRTPAMFENVISSPCCCPPLSSPMSDTIAKPASPNSGSHIQYLSIVPHMVLQEMWSVGSKLHKQLSR